MRVSASQGEGQKRGPKAPQLVSIRKIALVCGLPQEGQPAEKHPRGVHHEMRAYVFAASLISLSRWRASEFRITPRPLRALVESLRNLVTLSVQTTFV